MNNFNGIVMCIIYINLSDQVYHYCHMIQMTSIKLTSLTPNKYVARTPERDTNDKSSDFHHFYIGERGVSDCFADRSKVVLLLWICVVSFAPCLSLLCCLQVV